MSEEYKIILPKRSKAARKVGRLVKGLCIGAGVLVAVMFAIGFLVTVIRITKLIRIQI